MSAERLEGLKRLGICAFVLSVSYAALCLNLWVRFLTERQGGTLTGCRLSSVPFLILRRWSSLCIPVIVLVLLSPAQRPAVDPKLE
jgi:hypothetical protein